MSLANDTKDEEKDHPRRFKELTWDGKKDKARTYYDKYIKGNHELETDKRTILALRVLNCKG